jgi:hypothetical protein
MPSSKIVRLLRRRDSRNIVHRRDMLVQASLTFRLDSVGWGSTSVGMSVALAEIWRSAE